MGRVDESFAELAKTIELKEENERKRLESYRTAAQHHLSTLKFYEKVRLLSLPFKKGEGKPVWLTYFERYFSSVAENPKDTGLEDDFIIKQLNSLKCSFDTFLEEEFSKRSFILLAGIPILFFLNYGIFSNMNVPIIMVIKSVIGSYANSLKGIASFLSVPAGSTRFLIFLILFDIWAFFNVKHDRYLLYAYLLSILIPLLYISPSLPGFIHSILLKWKQLRTLYKIVITETAALIYLIWCCRREALAMCIEQIYGYAYEWARKIKEEI